jgi:hypothetical protein
VQRLLLPRGRLTVHRGKCAAPSSFSQTGHDHAETLCPCTAAAVAASSTACKHAIGPWLIHMLHGAGSCALSVFCNGRCIPVAAVVAVPQAVLSLRGPDRL